MRCRNVIPASKVAGKTIQHHNSAAVTVTMGHSCSLLQMQPRITSARHSFWKYQDFGKSPVSEIASRATLGSDQRLAAKLHKATQMSPPHSLMALFASPLENCLGEGDELCLALLLAAIGRTLGGLVFFCRATAKE